MEKLEKEEFVLPHVAKRSDGYYFYDPSYCDFGPFPTPEIADAALTHYLDNYF